MAVLKKEYDDLKASLDVATSRIKELEAAEGNSRELLQARQASIDKLEEDFSILCEEASMTKQELDTLKARSDREVALQWLQSPEGLAYLSSEWIKTEAGFFHVFYCQSLSPDSKRYQYLKR